MTDYERPQRAAPERAIEERLARMYAEQDNVVQVRRQVKMAGTQRADILVTHDDAGVRSYTIVEVKPDRANTVTLIQLLRYVSHFSGIVDPGTIVRGVAAAPKFSAVWDDLVSDPETNGIFSVLAVDA